VQAPVGVRVGLLRVMKQLVDGLLAAAHGESGVHLERLVRLARVIDPLLQSRERQVLDLDRCRAPNARPEATVSRADNSAAADLEAATQRERDCRCDLAVAIDTLV